MIDRKIRFASFVFERGYMKPGRTLVPLADYAGGWDGEILEGALELRIGSETILDLDLWNELDAMWDLMLEAAAAVVATQPFRDVIPHKTRFEFVCVPAPSTGDTCVGLRSPDRERTAIVRAADFATAVSEGAKAFVETATRLRTPAISPVIAQRMLSDARALTRKK